MPLAQAPMPEVNSTHMFFHVLKYIYIYPSVDSDWISGKIAKDGGNARSSTYTTCFLLSVF